MEVLDLTADAVETFESVLPVRRCTTLGDLGLRTFNEKGSSKLKCPVAATISMKDYLDSKICGQNNSVVPYSGQQIVTGIMSRVQDVIGSSNAEYGEVHVYRDHLRYDGYVETQTKETMGMSLLDAQVPISDLVFERVIGRIKLVDAGEFSQVLAFRYEPKFLEVAIGTNVNICQNFNIFGGKHFQSDRGFKYDTMMLALEDILSNLEDHFQLDLQLIKKMQSTNIGQDDINQMLGHMLQQYHTNNVIIPLTDISALSQQIIKSKAPTSTVWDFVNRGTEVLRFDNNSGESIMSSIKNFNEYTASYSRN